MSIDQRIETAIYNIGVILLIGYNRLTNMVSKYYQGDNNTTYVFFDGNDIPVQLQPNFKDENHVYYSVKDKYFYKGVMSELSLENLPYLALEVHRDADSYDLTSWISDIKAADGIVPTLKMLIMVWSLETSCIFDISKECTVNIINDEGDEKVIELNKKPSKEPAEVAEPAKDEEPAESVVSLYGSYYSVDNQFLLNPKRLHENLGPTA